MRRPRRTRFVAAGALAAAGAAALALTGPAPAVDETKPYALGITATPDADAASAGAEAWAGASPVVSITLTNRAKEQRLGSANVTIPTGIVLEPGAPVTLSAAGSATVSGGLIQLRNLNLRPKTSVRLDLTARIPCTPAPSYTWTTQAKQSNDFNGTGNNFALVTPQPVLGARGVCTLAFPADGQPASAQRNTNVTNEVFLPTSTRPVAVDVRDGSGNARVTWWNTPVTLSLPSASNPFGGVLSGTVSVAPTAGRAAFLAAGVGPRIDRSYGSYRFTATSTGITGAAPLSNPFAIVDSGQRCAAGQTCTGSSSSTTTRATVSGNATNSNDLLILSLAAPDAPSLDCPNYVESADVLAFDLTSLTGSPSGGTKTVTYTVLNPSRSASLYQICFRSPQVFRTRAGSLAPVQPDGTYLGLLPDCSTRRDDDDRYRSSSSTVTVPPPCVVSRVKTASGTVVLTVTAPQGDPWLRG